MSAAGGKPTRVRIDRKRPLFHRRLRGYATPLPADLAQHPELLLVETWQRIRWTRHSGVPLILFMALVNIAQCGQKRGRIR